MSIVWNIDRARIVGQPMSERRAHIRACELEAKGRFHYTVLHVSSTAA